MALCAHSPNIMAVTVEAGSSFSSILAVEHRRVATSKRRNQFCQLALAYREKIWCAPKAKNLTLVAAETRDSTEGDCCSEEGESESQPYKLFNQIGSDSVIASFPEPWVSDSVILYIVQKGIILLFFAIGDTCPRFFLPIVTAATFTI